MMKRHRLKSISLATDASSSPSSDQTWEQSVEDIAPILKLETQSLGRKAIILRVQTRQLWWTATPTTKFYYSSQSVKKHQAESDQIWVKLSNKLKKKTQATSWQFWGFQVQDSLKPELDFKTNTIPKTVRTRCLAGAVDNKAIPSGIICTPTVPGKWVIPNTHT